MTCVTPDYMWLILQTNFLSRLTHTSLSITTWKRSVLACKTIKKTCCIAHVMVLQSSSIPVTTYMYNQPCKHHHVCVSVITCSIPTIKSQDLWETENSFKSLSADQEKQMKVSSIVWRKFSAAAEDHCVCCGRTWLLTFTSVEGKIVNSYARENLCSRWHHNEHKTLCWL